VTTLLNTFVTTQKRVVQMIREGIFFFLKAIKTALFQQKNKATPSPFTRHQSSFHPNYVTLLSWPLFLTAGWSVDVVG